MRASDGERKQASQTVKTNSIFSSLNCFLPVHFLTDFDQVVIIQLDQQHDAGPSLTKSRCCCLLPKHGEKPGDFTLPSKSRLLPYPQNCISTAGTSCVENKQWDTNSPWLCKACFLCLPLFFILGLCLQTAFLLFTAIASVQTPVPTAGCQEVAFQPVLKMHHGLTRAQQSLLSACSNTESWKWKGLQLSSWKFHFYMIILPSEQDPGCLLLSSSFFTPAQLANEDVESQAKHTVDPKALACITSGETKTKK